MKRRENEAFCMLWDFTTSWNINFILMSFLCTYLYLWYPSKLVFFSFLSKIRAETTRKRTTLFVRLMSVKVAIKWSSVVRNWHRSHQGLWSLRLQRDPSWCMDSSFEFMELPFTSSFRCSTWLLNIKLGNLTTLPNAWAYLFRAHTFIYLQT